MTSSDIASAREIGCVVKLLAICELSPADEPADARASVSVRVHPAMIPRSHPLAAVGGAYNAVFVESRSAGRLMFYGPGAGGSPTASAVLGDLVTVGPEPASAGRSGPGESSYAALPVAPIDGVLTRYHLSLEVADVAGVLATIAQVLRRARRLDPDRPAARARGRGAAGDRDPPGRGRRPERDRRDAASSSTSSATVTQRDAGGGGVT